MRLLHLISWPYARKHVLRTALTVAGIVLGVAVFVAMHTANQGVLVAFSQTIDRIAGRTELQVTAGEVGFPEEVLETVQSARSVRIAVPVIEAVAESALPGQGTLLVLGIDMTGDRSLREYDLDEAEDSIVDDPLVFLAQPDSIIVSKELADRQGLSVGSEFPLLTARGMRPFIVRGVMRPAGLATAFGGNLAIMDVYAAQLMFGRGRMFDRIDIALTDGASVAEAQQELTALLGQGFEIQPPAARGEQAETMLAGYTVMVSISSAFALFIGLFIIYNSFATAVTQRRSEIGILRALGATRAQIRWLFLAESIVLGVLGSLLGLALGAAIAQATTTAMSGLAGDLYGVARQTSDAATRPIVLLMGLVAGVITSVVAAVVPARNAASVDPVEALQKSRHQIISRMEGRVRIALAVVAFALAAASLAATENRLIFYAGYALVLTGTVIVAPLIGTALARGLRPLLRRIAPVEGALAADSLIQAPRRTSATVLALMLSFALIIGFAGMARSSYESVLNWVNAALNPDLFVMPSPRLDVRTVRFPAELAPELKEIPGVSRVQMFRNSRINFRGVPVMLAAIEMASVAETTSVQAVAGRVPEMYREAARGEGLIISDSVAQKFDVSAGETIEIQAPGGTLRLPIIGVIVDYTDQQGTIFIDRRVWLEYWRDDSVSDFRIFVASGHEIADVRQRIVERYAGERQLFVLTSEQARSYVLGLTDQWFGLMNVQLAVAVFVAVLGIVNSLTVSIADRQRELGVLQAVGALRRQVRRTIWLEAVTVAIIGVTLGCVVGALNLYYVLDIVRRDVAGLRLEYSYPLSTVMLLIPAMLGAALVAALWPAEAAVRTPLVEALEYE